MKSKPEAMNHSDGGGADLDDLSDDPSSPESDNFDDSDLLSSTVHDEVTAQLAAAGKYHKLYKIKVPNLNFFSCALFVFRSSWSCCSSCHLNS